MAICFIACLQFLSAVKMPVLNDGEKVDLQQISYPFLLLTGNNELCPLLPGVCLSRTFGPSGGGQNQSQLRPKHDHIRNVRHTAMSQRSDVLFLDIQNNF